MRVKLPAFPNADDVVNEEAAAFRQLSSDERFLTILDTLSFGEQWISSSPDHAKIAARHEAEKDQWCLLQKEFLTKHVRRTSEPS
jgi:hypothetical protein